MCVCALIIIYFRTVSLSVSRRSSGRSYVVAKSCKSPLAYDTISVPPNLDSPYNLSTNVMGT